MKISDTVPERANLLKILGVTFGIAVTIGGMIGLGILRTPGTVAAALGDPWLIIGAWIAGGIYALFGTVQAAELATAIPKTGGPYVFARRAFGEYPGFLVGWMDWIVYPAGLALTAIAVGEYLVLLIPEFSNVKLAALAFLLILGTLNMLGLRVGSRLQELSSFLKAAVFLGLIAACFIFGGGGSVPGAETEMAPLGLVATVGALVIALQGVIFAYDGWYAAVYFSEENTNPTRDLPRAMIAGVLAVMGIYLLFNLGLLYVLPVDQIAASTLPAADAATAIFGGYGSQVITILAIISLCSITNSTLMMAPRILFALGRDGLFTAKAGTVNSGGTPVVGLLITLGCAIPLILIGTFEKLLAVSAFLYIAIYLSAFLAIFVLRKREPELPRPFRAWGYPYTTLIVLAGSAAFLVGAVVSDTENSLWALGLVVISYPMFLLTRKLTARNRNS